MSSYNDIIVIQGRIVFVKKILLRNVLGSDRGRLTEQKLVSSLSSGLLTLTSGILGDTPSHEVM